MEGALPPEGQFNLRKELGSYSNQCLSSAMRLLICSQKLLEDLQWKNWSYLLTVTVAQSPLLGQRNGSGRLQHVIQDPSSLSQQRKACVRPYGV